MTIDDQKNLDDRVPLKDVAARLSGYSKFMKTRTRGKRELLQLLQNSLITASFRFPSRGKPCIDIPADFWLRTGSRDFQGALRSTSRRGKYGQFLIKPAEFIVQYVAWFSANYLAEDVGAEKRKEASPELASALAGVNTKIEAMILESEFNRFVQDAGITEVKHQDQAASSSGGAKALQAWEVVLVEVASEMLARQQRGEDLGRHPTAIGKKALGRAANSLKKGRRLPEVDTVYRKVTEIIKGRDALLEAIETSSKKIPDKSV